jgi:antitoxin component of MazEF toxin-antitoxin module
MKIAVRRIGNSLGVIVPKPILEAWGIGEGDQLELTARGIRPAARPGLSHQALDELKRSIALAVVRRFTPNQIRAQILANLHRWCRQGGVGVGL